MKELSETDRKILAVLADYPQGLFLWQVQKYASLPLRQYALYYMKKLMKKGLVRHEEKLYFLVQPALGVKPHAKAARLVSESITQTPSQAMRIHSLALSFPLRTPMAPDQPSKLGIEGARLAGLKNQQSVYFMQEGFNLMLTPNNLIIYAEQLSLPLDASIAEGIRRMTFKAYGIALKVEDRYGLELRRLDRDTLVADIMLNHNALTNSEVARVVLEKGEKFQVRDERGTLRVIVDFSHGIAEFEAVSAQYGLQDLAKLRALTLAAITGEFDYRITNESVHQLTMLMETQAKDIKNLKKVAVRHSEDLNGLVFTLIQPEPPSPSPKPRREWN